MSGVAHEQDTDWDEVENYENDEEEDFVDEVAEWFMESGPTDSLVIHHHTCDTHEGRRLCSCIPVTLVRGAKA